MKGKKKKPVKIELNAGGNDILLNKRQNVCLFSLTDVAFVQSNKNNLYKKKMYFPNDF